MYEVWGFNILLTIRGLPLGAKSRLYFTCVYSIMLYKSETWPAKKMMWSEERNNGTMVDG